MTPRPRNATFAISVSLNKKILRKGGCYPRRIDRSPSTRTMHGLLYSIRSAPPLPPGGAAEDADNLKQEVQHGRRKRRESQGASRGLVADREAVRQGLDHEDGDRKSTRLNYS